MLIITLPLRCFPVNIDGFGHSFHDPLNGHELLDVDALGREEPDLPAFHPAHCDDLVRGVEAVQVIANCPHFHHSLATEKRKFFFNIRKKTF